MSRWILRKGWRWRHCGVRRRRATPRSAILDIAERLVQSRGFNGFSYADVAGELGITKAALHYHFPGKAELGEELVIRYAARFLASLAAIGNADTSAAEKLRAYADLYLGVASRGRMCLCGMLAADYETLSGPMRHAVLSFFDDNLAWLAELLEAGRAQGSLAFSGTSRRRGPDDHRGPGGLDAGGPGLRRYELV